MERPFPFRKTMDPAQYASYFHEASGKQCIVYKSVVESSIEDFDNWITNSKEEYGHTTFNLVGAPSSTMNYKGPSLVTAGSHVKARGDVDFGCVCIPERHTKKGNEDANMFKKTQMGAEWFITQGVFASAPIIKLIQDYGELCKRSGIQAKKVVITFAPCGRPKTMTFIKWLGMDVPEEVETRILGAASPVKESMDVLCDILKEILTSTKDSGVPLGLNVESLSIFKDEIDAAHELFQRLQAILLNSYSSPWALKWYFVEPGSPRDHLESVDKNFKALKLSPSGNHLVSSEEDKQEDAEVVASSDVRLTL